MRNIAFIVGSLSRQSVNRHIDKRTGAFLDKFAASFFNWVNKD